MNILFTSYASIGVVGGEVSVKTLMDELNKRGHKVIIASTTDFGSNTHFFHKFRYVPSYTFHEWYLSRFLIKLIKKKNIDLVHVHDRLTAVPAIIAAKKCKIPVVVHFRDYWFGCPRSSFIMPNGKTCNSCDRESLKLCSGNYLRYLWNLHKFNYLKRASEVIKKTDVKIAISSSVKNRLIESGIKDIDIVPNPVDISKFKFNKKLQQKYGILFIGRLEINKGVKLLPELYSRLKIPITVVGDGSMREYLSKKEGIKLLGQVSHDKIPEIIGRSEVVIFPSTWEEPFGRVAIEAMAAGKPLVASKVGGLKDIVKEGFNGFLVEPHDLDGWVKKIKILFSDKKLRKKISDNALKSAELYSSDKIAHNIEKVYSRLIKN